MKWQTPIIQNNKQKSQFQIKEKQQVNKDKLRQFTPLEVRLGALEG